MSKESKIQLQYVPFEKLVFLSDNPRTRTGEGLEKMISDIKADPTFYENRPTLVNFKDGKYNVYGGDLRAHAAHNGLGWKDIPCNVENDVTDDLMRRRAILDNTHREDWDADALDGWEFDKDELEEMGVDAWVDDEQMEYAPEGDNTKGTPVEEDDFDLPEIETVKTDIKLGDLFEIGAHRLLCGDSTDAELLSEIANGSCVDLYITDPPYGVSYADKNKSLNSISKGNRIQTEILNDHLSVSDSADLWLRCFTAANTIMSKKCSYYIFSAQGGELMMMMMMIDKVFQLKHTLVWVKNNHVLGRCDYSYKHEPILYGWVRGGTHEFFGGFKTSVINYNKPSKNDLHPTMKPVGLISELIQNSSKEGQIIFDSFLGSGTTMVASDETGRICYGMELDPKYCDVIVRRMAKLNPSLTIKRNGVEETEKWAN